MSYLKEEETEPMVTLTPRRRVGVPPTGAALGRLGARGDWGWGRDGTPGCLEPQAAARPLVAGTWSAPWGHPEGVCGPCLWWSLRCLGDLCGTHWALKVGRTSGRPGALCAQWCRQRG